MKKLFVGIVAALLTVSLFGCGVDKPTQKTSDFSESSILESSESFVPESSESEGSMNDIPISLEKFVQLTDEALGQEGYTKISDIEESVSDGELAGTPCEIHSYKISDKVYIYLYVNPSTGNLMEIFIYGSEYREMEESEYLWIGYMEGLVLGGFEGDSATSVSDQLGDANFSETSMKFATGKSCNYTRLIDSEKETMIFMVTAK